MNPHIESGRRAFLAGTTGALGGLASGSWAQSASLEGSRSVSVRDFGAAGDGRADDTAAIQKAIDAVTGTGGVVRFPPGRYRITATLRVRSPYPVSLLGEMLGHIYDAQSVAAALLPGADMDYLVEYAAPDPAARAVHGAGTVQRLAFVDATSPDNAAPGRWRIVAALHLRDFALGLVDGCTFQWIRGSAIKTDFAVMASVRGCRIRYCGNPSERGRSAVLLDGTSPTFTTQSFLLDDSRIEVCFGSSYISVTRRCYDVTIRSCSFEAATVEYPTSSKTFVEIFAERFLIDGCTFNRTDAVAVVLSGRGKLVNSHFVNGIGAATSLQLSGDRCIVSNCIFEDNRVALSIDCAGVQNQLVGNIFYYSGGVRMTGRGNVFAANQISNPRMRGPGWWLVLADHCVAEGNRFDGNGSSVQVGAIVTRNSDRVTNNSFDRWPGETCIRRESAASTIFGNSFTEVTRSYSESVPAVGVQPGPGEP